MKNVEVIMLVFKRNVEKSVWELAVSMLSVELFLISHNASACQVIREIHSVSVSLFRHHNRSGSQLKNLTHVALHHVDPMHFVQFGIQLVPAHVFLTTMEIHTLPADPNVLSMVSNLFGINFRC